MDLRALATLKEYESEPEMRIRQNFPFFKRLSSESRNGISKTRSRGMIT